MNKKKIAVAVSAAIVLGLTVPGLYNGLKVQRYSVSSDKINSKIRIALLTDTHSCRHGKDERKLIDMINEEKPDLILFGGDIFDDKKSIKNTEKLIAGISSDYPCYYVTGNHEYKNGKEDFDAKMAILEKYGVIRLSDESTTININGEEINLCGVDDPICVDYPFDNIMTMEEQLEKFKDTKENGKFTILLSHRPELIKLYSEYGFDMALCGHAHGGQIRIPGLLNGLFSTCEGFFPKYAGGVYEENGMTEIVSRGLSRETTIVPRIYNRPELVIIDLK